MQATVCLKGVGWGKGGQGGLTPPSETQGRSVGSRTSQRRPWDATLNKPVPRLIECLSLIGCAQSETCNCIALLLWLSYTKEFTCKLEYLACAEELSKLDTGITIFSWYSSMYRFFKVLKTFAREIACLRSCLRLLGILVRPQGAHTICLWSRLLFYSKCTGFTVCLT